MGCSNINGHRIDNTSRWAFERLCHRAYERCINISYAGGPVTVHVFETAEYRVEQVRFRRSRLFRAGWRGMHGENLGGIRHYTHQNHENTQLPTSGKSGGWVNALVDFV